MLNNHMYITIHFNYEIYYIDVLVNDTVGNPKKVFLEKNVSETKIIRSKEINNNKINFYKNLFFNVT